MVDAVAHIDVKATWRTKQRFVLRRHAPVAVTGGVVLGIRLRFHNHAPEQASISLAFHKPAAHQIGGNDLGRAAEEVLGKSWE